MAMACSKLIMLLLLLVSLSFVFCCGGCAAAIAEDFDRWCDTIPHPGPCKYYFTGHRVAPKEKSDFRRMLIQAALDRAIRAQRHIYVKGAKYKNHREKAAWADCIRLHDYTIHELNETLTGLHGPRPEKCTGQDAQTWLSTALTNLDTCRASYDELKVSEFMQPLVSHHNVSELISNSLAIYDGVLPEVGGEKGEHGKYPSWVTAGGRRLLQARRSLLAAKAKIVVARDGSGGFSTVQAAINAAAKRGGGSMGRMFVIYVKKGVYRENILVAKNVNYIMLVGDGLKRTIITGSRSTKAGFTTYNTATAGIDGVGFVARGITFQNSAGPQNGQAVALRSASDLSVFYRCAFLGYQDTIFTHSQRQFYKGCYIYGTIDIVFGNAAAVFQSCIFYVRKPMHGQGNTITAQGRGDPNQNTGIAIHRSQILATPELQRALGSVKTYLGRPWQQYSRTVIMSTYIGNLIDPAGWSPWGNTDFAQSSLYYGEYKNYGPSSPTSRRVRWAGYHIITNPREANRFTVGGFIAGGSWLPAAGVPFIAGL